VSKYSQIKIHNTQSPKIDEQWYAPPNINPIESNTTFDPI